MDVQEQFIPRDSSDGGGAFVTISGTTLVAAVVFLVLLVVFVFFLYLYVKRHLAGRGSGAQFVFVEGLVPGPSRGLDAAVLRSLPVTVYLAADFREGLECSVCLSELADGEEVRLLPKCNHGFHLECIDMWFHSHATCPLCRSPVGSEAPDAPVSAEVHETAQDPPSEAVPEVPTFTTNVSFRRILDQANDGIAMTPAVAAEGADGGPSTTSSNSMKPGRELVIEIPSRAVDANCSPVSPLPPSSLPTEEMKTPASSRFRTLTRLLSLGKRTAGPSYSPREGDIEHGVGAEGSASTPRTQAS